MSYLKEKHETITYIRLVIHVADDRIHELDLPGGWLGRHIDGRDRRGKLILSKGQLQRSKIFQMHLLKSIE
jgi:hypothetical protein